MTRKWFTGLLVLGMVGTMQGQLRSKQRFTPSSSQLAGAIVKALSARGIEINTSDVALLATVPSTSPLPELEVLSIAAVEGRAAGTGHPRSTVRVACHEASECLPFYAVVNWAESARVSSGAFRAGPVAAGPIVMRTGSRATLSMEDGRAHVEISVVSLESGAAGQVVRVQTLDRKRIFSGEIVSARLLKGTF